MSADKTVEAGIDINVRDERGLTALHRAAGVGDANAVEALLARGADPCALDSRLGASPLHHAAQGGSVEVARLLLEAGAFLNLQAPSHGMTPLMVAVWHRRPALVEYFLNRPEINVALQNVLGITAAELVGLGSRGPEDPAHAVDEQIRAYFDAYAARRARTLERQTLFTSLTNEELSSEEKRERVRSLLAAGVEVDTVSPIMNSGSDGHTPLLVAARDGHAEIVRLLLEAGADQTATDAYMLAVPAHKAAYFGHAGVLRVLTDHPSFAAVADAQGPFNGYTPLHDAVWHGHTEAASVLLQAGVRTDIAGLDGRTALDLARDNGYDELVALLTSQRQSPSAGSASVRSQPARA